MPHHRRWLQIYSSVYQLWRFARRKANRQQSCRAGGDTMVCERFEKLPDGPIVRHCERQLGLADWQFVEDWGWVRVMREWTEET